MRMTSVKCLPHSIDFKAQSCASKRVYYFVIEKTPTDSVKELGRKTLGVKKNLSPYAQAKPVK